VIEERPSGTLEPMHAAPRTAAPGWLKGVMAFMGACTPGGFLFLFALLTESSVRFETPVWFLMAGAGGVGGYMLARRAGA
jgi:hypothetical protein